MSERAHERPPRPWVFDNGVAHRQRRGVRVPAAECLPPFDRVGVREFCALMERMLGEEEEVAL